MKTNPLKEGIITNHFTGIGTVSPDLVRERAVELAIINGRSAHDVVKSDWDQAHRELAGEPDMDPNTAVLEGATEAESWDPLPGSTGQKTPVLSNEDEDKEGRSDSERLGEEGAAEAEHDRMLAANKAADRKEP